MPAGRLVVAADARRAAAATRARAPRHARYRQPRRAAARAADAARKRQLGRDDPAHRLYCDRLSALRARKGGVRLAEGERAERAVPDGASGVLASSGTLEE
jgi:hypothetical protein